MSLLSVKDVSKRHGRGRSERLVLRDVSLNIEAGELVVVWGLRRSGRTTLVRIATGMERPDEGTVLFAGEDLARRRDKVLGREIGCAQLHHPLGGGGSVLDHVADGVLAGKVSLSTARRRAREALAEVGAEGCLEFSLHELDAGEAVRVALACALIGGPRLLVVDEPTNGVDLMDRDPILRLLRGIANRGVAVLMTTGDGAALAGVDRPFTLNHGELLGGDARPLASVTQLRRHSSEASARSQAYGAKRA